MKLKTTIALTAVAILATACGRDEDAKNATAAKPDSAVERITKSNDPKGDTSVLREKYKELTSGKQLLAQYVRMAGVPEDLSKFAPQLNNEYASADAFKKKDIEAKLRESLPALAKQAEADGAYLWINWNGEMGLGEVFEGPYNFDKKGFVMFDFHKVERGPNIGRTGERSRTPVYDEGVLTQLSDGGSMYLSNWADFELMSVPDEAAARLMEAEREATAYYKGMSDKLRNAKYTMRVHVFVAAPGKEVGSVRAQIMKLVVVDKKGNIVAQM